MDSKDQRTGWLATLKPGDMVIESGGFWSNAKVSTVERISPTGRITVGHDVYSPEGRMFGSGYGGSLREATPDEVKFIREKSTVKHCLSLMRDARSITYDKAVKIIEILETQDEGAEEATK